MGKVNISLDKRSVSLTRPDIKEFILRDLTFLAKEYSGFSEHFGVTIKLKEDSFYIHVESRGCSIFSLWCHSSLHGPNRLCLR